MDFKVGDYVYIDSPGWESGVIVEIDGDIATVEYSTGNGGGSMACGFDELVKAYNFSNAISRMCYELYKLDWERRHIIFPEDRMMAVKDYYNYLNEEDYSESYFSYEDYLSIYGYGGRIFASFSEFCRSEYRNKDYIHGLLHDDGDMIAAYDDDITRR